MGVAEQPRANRHTLRHNPNSFVRHQCCLKPVVFVNVFVAPWARRRQKSVLRESGPARQPPFPCPIAGCPSPSGSQIKAIVLRNKKLSRENRSESWPSGSSRHHLRTFGETCAQAAPSAMAQNNHLINRTRCRSKLVLSRGKCRKFKHVISNSARKTCRLDPSLDRDHPRNGDGSDRPKEIGLAYLLQDCSVCCWAVAMIR